MLTISKPSANRVDIALSGTLDADEMRTALDQLIEASNGITQGQLLYTIGDFEMPTLGAMAVELSKMPQLFRLAAAFDRCAVLCDTGWIRTAAEIEGAIIPTLTIKSFTLADAKAAQSWLEGIDDDHDFENFPV
jgi:hypothetical protein